MLTRPMVRLGGAVQPMQAGLRQIDNRILSAIDGDNQAITVAAIIAGIVNRTGTTAATADTLPSVDSLLAVLTEMTRGDSVGFSIRMANAHANTITVGAGMTAVGTVNVLASNIREYLLTLTSENRRTLVTTGSTTNASGVLTNIPKSVAASIGVGMAVTGTNVGASAKVVAINDSINGTNTVTVTVSVVSTGTGDNIALTFTPQMDLLGVGTRAI